MIGPVQDEKLSSSGAGEHTFEITIQGLRGFKPQDSQVCEAATWRFVIFSLWCLTAFILPERRRLQLCRNRASCLALLRWPTCHLLHIVPCLTIISNKHQRWWCSTFRRLLNCGCKSVVEKCYDFETIKIRFQNLYARPFSCYLNMP